jgi:hypothetical protein
MAPTSESTSRWLVTTDWLGARLGAPDLAVVDGSFYLPAQKRDAAAEYLAGHLPGAVRFDLDSVSDHANPLPHMLPKPDQFGRDAGALGIGQRLGDIDRAHPLQRRPVGRTTARPAPRHVLEFERPLAKLEQQIQELEALQAAKNVDYTKELRQLRTNYTSLLRKTYDNLSAWETVQVARHQDRSDTNPQAESTQWGLPYPGPARRGGETARGAEPTQAPRYPHPGPCKNGARDRESGNADAACGRSRQRGVWRIQGHSDQQEVMLAKTKQRSQEDVQTKRKADR